jgi:hypothetical protein
LQKEDVDGRDKPGHDGTVVQDIQLQEQNMYLLFTQSVLVIVNFCALQIAMLKYC